MRNHLRSEPAASLPRPSADRPKTFPGQDRLIRLRLTLDRRRLSGLALAALVSLGVYQLSLNSTSGELGPLIQVSVATRDLPSGHQLRPEDLASRWWPRDVLPRGATITSPIGQTLVSPLAQNQVLLESGMAPGSLGLRADEVAVTLPIPLAPPPLEIGQSVLLISVQAFEGPFVRPAAPIATSRVVAIGDTSATVAVLADAANDIIGTLATGAIEMVILPD